MVDINKILVFSAAAHGFHVCYEVWSLCENEELTCPFERNILFYMFTVRTCRFEDVVVICTCNAATLEAKLRNGVDSILIGGNSLSIGGWIV